MKILGEKLLTQALKDVNLVAQSQDATADELELAVDEMDELLDQLATDKQFITGASSKDFPFVAGQHAYTLGPDGDWPIEELPESISAWSVIENPGQESERERTRGESVGIRRWQGISNKLTRSESPRTLYAPGKFDQETGQVTLYFAPVPSGTGRNARLYFHASAITHIDPAKTYILPRGYAKALRKMCAVELMQSQQRDLDPVLVFAADKGLKLIKRGNRKFRPSPVDSSLLGDLGYRRFDIRS